MLIENRKQKNTATLFCCEALVMFCELQLSLHRHERLGELLLKELCHTTVTLMPDLYTVHSLQEHFHIVFLNLSYFFLCRFFGMAAFLTWIHRTPLTVQTWTKIK